MTTQVLAPLIYILCLQYPIKDGRQMDCWDYYNNCAVTINGIMTEKEFDNKCHYEEKKK